MEVFTIGQLAQEAGVHVETVRYYERRRLLREPPRTNSGYRQYSTADLRRLQFIARAKGLGFTLSEIAGLVGPDDRTTDNGTGTDNGSADTVVRMARAKIRALDEQQGELAATRSRLEQLIDVCEDPGSDDCLSLRVTS